MAPANLTDKAIEMAQVCLTCPVRDRARGKQQGVAYLFVKHVEGSLCPSCQAYGRVYGIQADAPRQ